MVVDAKENNELHPTQVGFLYACAKTYVNKICHEPCRRQVILRGFSLTVILPSKQSHPQCSIALDLHLWLVNVSLCCCKTLTEAQLRCIHSSEVTKYIRWESEGYKR